MFALRLKTASQATKLARGAQFSSTVDREALFKALMAEASQIGDYNFRSYFVRRAAEDQTRADTFSVEELTERLEQMKRIRLVQNVYSLEQSVVQQAKNTQ